MFNHRGIIIIDVLLFLCMIGLGYCIKCRFTRGINTSICFTLSQLALFYSVCQEWLTLILWTRYVLTELFILGPRPTFQSKKYTKSLEKQDL